MSNVNREWPVVVVMAIAVDKPRQLMNLAMMTVAVMTVTVVDCCDGSVIRPFCL